MHPRLAELVDYATAQRTELFAAVSLVPEPLRQQRAEAASWSVAEVLEHLHRVERGITRVLVDSLERAKDEGIGPELEAGSLMQSLERFQLAQRGRPLSAPEPVRPRGRFSAAEALEALTNSRQAFLSALDAADGLALGAITYPHPLLGPLDLYQWVLFVGQHEARHAAQIRDIAGRLLPA